jgi:thiamine pyrophosphokinase
MMSRNKCVIVGASPECAVIERSSFVISADGGYDRCVAAGITPDLIIGDFDSTEITDFSAETIRFPREKDASDTQLAVREAIRRGFGCFHIYGALGGRLDHTLANIALMAELTAQGYGCCLIGKSERLSAVCNSRLVLESGAKSRSVSVFSADERAVGVTLTGFRYPLTDAVLVRGSHGLSNEVLPSLSGEGAVIEVRAGCLIVVENFSKNLDKAAEI